MKNISPSKISRRSFVTTAAAGVAAIGAFSNMTPSARAQMVETKSHWDIAAFNRLVNHPARAKQLFDATAGNGSVFDHVHNSFNGLQFGFGIPKDQMQLVAIMRGMATILLFDDYIWKKYQIGAKLHIKDPKTGKPAERNIFYPSRAGAKMLYATAEATVPKVTVIMRKAYGAGYYVMCGKAYEPDLIVAWPSAEISVMGAEVVVEIAFRKAVEAAEDPAAKRAELIANFKEMFDVYIAAGNDLIDDVIDPRETRETICRALEMAEGKRVERPWKRHGVVPV